MDTRDFSRKIDDLNMLEPGKKYRLVKKGDTQAIAFTYIGPGSGYGSISVKILNTGANMEFRDVLDKFEIREGALGDYVEYDRRSGRYRILGGLKGRKRKTRCKKSSKGNCRKSSRRRKSTRRRR